MGLWSTKSIALLQTEAATGTEVTLKRAPGALNLTMLGIGAIIGAGIFRAHRHRRGATASLAIVLSFVLAGLGRLFAGLATPSSRR